MFAKVFERIKNPSKFVDINDVSTRSEYWGTYLLLSLPLGLLGAIFTSIVYFCDIDSEGLSKSLMVLGTCLSMLSSLVFYPVFVRRVRDVGLSPWIALACFAPAFFPYVGGLTGVAIIVFGCIPSKTGSAEKCTAGACNAAMFWAASVVLFMFIGIRMMQGTMSSVQEYKLEQIGKAMEKAAKEMERSFRW
jgi:uncharacterized membrane protein YhaH (DUF805 family)